MLCGRATCNSVCFTGIILAAIVCCLILGVGPVLVTVSALGLGFALASPVLIPVVLAALALTTWGLWLGFRSHGRAEPFTVGLVGAAATALGLFVWNPAVVMGLAVLGGAIVWSMVSFWATAGLART